MVRLLTSLVVTVALLAGSTTAIAGEGATVGTVLGATVGALTFSNKNTGAAVGAGVGLMAGMIADAEKKRARERRMEQVREVRPSRTTVTRAPRTTTRRQPAQTRTYRDPEPSPRDTGHLVREHRVTSRTSDGKVKVTTTRIYDDPGW